jgi:hypothetical protein
LAGDVSRVEVDLGALAASLGDALREAGFELGGGSLDAALRGYERWLGEPVPGLVWGETDCAIVMVEPRFDGCYEVDLRRHVGEAGVESSVGVSLTLGLDPMSAGEWGTTSEALDERAAEWVASLRRHRVIATGLGGECAVVGELRIEGQPFEARS